ncbi:ABC transporter permease [Eggerthella sinensis]|uniref:ABC transporter permease n=1 Tax=Eggerthella sinensis TaxID=242230 RepID=UPI001D087762|nr:ABC transporter permease subunit [Eggerthella sinensis]MCB7037416.1 ABC transporter permease subunit [Eggerthella sinensis]
MRGRRAGRAAAMTLVVMQTICVLAPLGVVVAWACTSAWPWPDLVPSSFSARGLEELFAPSQQLVPTLVRSVGIALAVALVATSAATLAARALVHHAYVGREVFRFATVLPFIIPSTVFAMGVQMAFIRAGLAGTFVGVIVAHAIVALPYAVVIMVEVTEAAGSRLEEQARTLGAGPMRAFFEVQLPLLLPGLLSAATMSYIVSFSQYFLTLLVGGGAVKTLALTMFPYLASGDRTIASAYGVVFMVATLAVFLVFELVLRRVVSRPTDYFEG